MKFRAEVLAFIEAQARLSDASRKREQAIHQYDRAERRFRGAWGELTKAEQNAINAACDSTPAPSRTGRRA